MSFEDYLEKKLEGCVGCKASFTGGSMGLGLKKYKRSYTIENLEGLCGACKRSKRTEAFDRIQYCRKALRRAFRFSDVAKNFKKDMEVARDIWECSSCGKITKDADLEHTDPVIPPDNPYIDLEEFSVRLFENRENWTMMCKSCHNVKTNKDWKGKTKYKRLTKPQ